MANVLNRITKEYRVSVNTPDYSESEWVINPNLSAVKDLPVSHWIIDGDEVRPPNEAESAIIDAEVLSLQKQVALAEVDNKTAMLLQSPIMLGEDGFVDMASDTYKSIQDIVMGVKYGIIELPQSIPLIDGGTFTIEDETKLMQVIGVIFGRRRAIAEAGNALRNRIRDAVSLDALSTIQDERE